MLKGVKDSESPRRRGSSLIFKKEIKQLFLSKDSEMEVETLLPPGEVQVYINDMGEVSNRRGEGADIKS